MWLDTSQRGVKGQFSHRNAHTVSTEVAQTQDALAIGDDDSADILFGPVAQHAVDMSLIVNGDEKTARATIDDTKLLTGQTNRRCINDGHHVFHVLGEDAVEQTLIAILPNSTIH